MRRRTTVGVLVGVTCLAAGAFGITRTVLAGNDSPPSAVNRVRAAVDDLPARVQGAAKAAGLDLNSSRRIGSDVFLVQKGAAELCMVNTSHGMSMGCAPRTTFFGGHVMRWGIAENGAPSSPTDMTISGVARTNVASIRVVFPASTRTTATSTDGGFSIHAEAELLAGGRPTTIEALDETGAVISSEPLPQS